MSPWIFLSFTFIIISGVYFYIGWRIIIPAQLNFPWNWAAWLMLVISLLLLYIPFVLTVQRYNSPFIDLMAWIGYISLGFFSLVFAFLLVKDLFAAGTFLFNKAVHLANELLGRIASGPGIEDPERRKFLINSYNFGILGLSALATGYGMYEALKKPYLKNVTVPIKNLPDEFDGFTIAQFTDVHVGPTVKRKSVEMIVKEINNLKPDLIAFTGDLVDGSVSYLKNDVEPCKDLHAPFGKYFVTGNHEYYSGAEPWIEMAKYLGFNVLLNEHRVIEKNKSKLIIAGVTDTSAGQFIKSHKTDPKSAIKGAPESEVKILLAHQPKSLYEAADAGYNLQLSGHTHGGQYVPWNYFATLGQPFIKGLNKYKDTWIYVSQGTGYWGPPLRIGASSEITYIKLVKEVKA